jgi:hypothetical protein
MTKPAAKDPADKYNLPATMGPKLMSLGVQFEELRKKQEALLIDARKAIGFQHPKSSEGIEDELGELWRNIDDRREIFLHYAETNRDRWAMEEAVASLKIIMERQGIEPKTILAMLDQ